MRGGPGSFLTNSSDQELAKRLGQLRVFETKKKVSPSPPPSIDVREIRRAAGGCQEWFAAALNISVATLRNWEQGRNPPSGAALTLLRMIEHDPRTMIEILHRIDRCAYTTRAA